jgi:DNA invertase Pin-like site-specific DNA recombinase
MSTRSKSRGATHTEVKVKPLALYARVSTDDQNVDGQLTPLREYAQRRDVEAIEFVDSAVSGRRSSRPALDHLLKAVRRREVSAVVVVRLDRLARSLTHMAQLGEEFRELGTELVSLTEGIDTSTSTGRALFGMCAVFAQLEADLIRERTVAGLQAARRRGRQLGRPKKIFDRRQVQRAQRLHRSGKSVRQIADVLGVSKSMAHRILTSN